MNFSCSAQFSNLKKNVLEAGIYFNLEQVKECFADVINSPRALSRVKSLACILKLLEERDVLNFNNVNCLEQLGDLIHNEKIKDLVHHYKKNYLSEGIEEPQCDHGIQISLQPDLFPVFQQQENYLPIQNENNNAFPVLDLLEPLRNISQRIGKSWPYLARELDIEEGYIDYFRVEYPEDIERQANAALGLWLSRKRESATIELLDTALNSRHCKRHGLGSHLLQPGIVPL